MYDVTNPESLKKVRDWVKELNKMLGTNNIRLAVIGNKIDLLTLGEQKCPQNNPLIEEAMQFTNELTNARHYLTSAKLNQGISELFNSLSKRMVSQAKRLSASNHASASSSVPRFLSVTNHDDQQDDEWRSIRKPYGSRIDLSSNKASKQGASCSC